MARTATKPKSRVIQHLWVFGMLGAVLVSGCGRTVGQEASPVVFTQTPAYAPAAPADRYLAVISDLHLGLGCPDPDHCTPTEDFRWPNALRGFLDEVSKLGDNRVDLVIAGDFLELWQPPDSIKCKGLGGDLGCTVKEAEAIARVVVAAHPKAFAALKDFAARGDNRIHVIPGNHDSTLLLAKVWDPVGRALGVSSKHIDFVAGGVWKTADGRTVVEHGHQIGSDANKYADWPRGIVRRVDGTDYVVRPWGERFVQVLFNEQERAYPIIDNLSPETAGVRYRMADRGVWQSAADVARFLAFNLWETSLAQKIQILGPGDEEDPVEWDPETARSLGADLFLGGLTPDDPFRRAALGDSPKAAALRQELADLAKRLKEPDLRSYCDLLAIRKADRLCVTAILGAGAEHLFTERRNVLKAHFEGLLEQDRRITQFIYGHTHKYEEPWRVNMTPTDRITVANTGAFQRVIEDENYKVRARTLGYGEVEGLSKMKPEDLAPCYTVVLAPPAPATTERAISVQRWHMPEDGAGSLVHPGDKLCH